MSTTLYAVSSDGTVSTSYTQYLVTSERTVYGVLLYGFGSSNRDYYAAGRSRQVAVSDYLTISPDRQYSMRFSHMLNINLSYNISVYVVVYSNGSVKKIPVYDEKFSGNSSTLNTSDFSFKLSSTDLGSSYRCRLYIEHTFSGGSYGSSSTDMQVYQLLQKYITIVDDDVGWLVKIYNAIKAIPSNLSGFFSSLGDRISGFFSDLKTNMGNWFAEQGQKIQDFSNGVKQWFKELGDRIQGFFVDLYNDIIEGLKSLFIPADGYFESKKTELETFCIEHFGALYQAPDVMLDFVVKLTTISPKVPSITMPAIQFDFQGVRYVLCESIIYSFSWVNDSSNALFYFYKFYRGFATLLLFLFFGNFCIKKYNEVFAGGAVD